MNSTIEFVRHSGTPLGSASNWSTHYFEVWRRYPDRAVNRWSTSAGSGPSELWSPQNSWLCPTNLHWHWSFGGNRLLSVLISVCGLTRASNFVIFLLCSFYHTRTMTVIFSCHNLGRFRSRVAHLTRDLRSWFAFSCIVLSTRYISRTWSLVWVFCVPSAEKNLSTAALESDRRLVLVLHYGHPRDINFDNCCASCRTS